MEKFDQAALEPEAGVRAIWLLYKRGAWGYLEDFGMSRAEAEPVLRQFERENLITGRLSKAQCRHLLATVPGLAGAGVELRLAYALKFLDAGVLLDREEFSRILKEKAEADEVLPG